MTKKDVVIIKKEGIGQSENKDLELLLLKAYLCSLDAMDEKPSHIILYSDGVKLATNEGDHTEHFNELIEAGVTILVCGACLKYYKIEDKVLFGESTNMFEICELLENAKNVINP